MANAAKKMKEKKQRRMLVRQAAAGKLVLESVVEPIVEDFVEDVDVVEAIHKHSNFDEDVDEPTSIEGGNVTDVEVVEVVKKKRKSRKIKL